MKTTSAYDHGPATSTVVKPDTKPGPYYVSAIDDDHQWLLAGPFSTHQEALDRVDECRRISIEYHDRACWFAYGTCRMKDSNFSEPGILNARGLLQ